MSPTVQSYYTIIAFINYVIIIKTKVHYPQTYMYATLADYVSHIYKPFGFLSPKNI